MNINENFTVCTFAICKCDLAGPHRVIGLIPAISKREVIPDGAEGASQFECNDTT